jgi:hypothetical protein
MRNGERNIWDGNSHAPAAHVNQERSTLIMLHRNMK